MDTLSFNRIVAVRQDYFRNNRLGEPPVEQEERYRLALSLLKEERPDYKAVILLYDDMEDAMHARFLNVMGFIYGSPESPFFNDEAALEFCKRAYRNTDIPQEKAYAAQLFLTSYFRLADVQPKQFHELYKNPYVVEMMKCLAENKIQSRAFLNKSVSNGASYFTATFYGAGTGVERNDEVAVRLYEGSLANMAGYIWTASYALSLRYMLGLGCKRSPEKVPEVLDRHKKATLKPVPDIFYAEMLEYARKVQDPAYSSAADLIVEKRRRGFSAFSVLDEIRNAGPDDRKAMLETLDVMVRLSDVENWPDHEEWNNAYLYAFSFSFPHPPRRKSALPSASIYKNTYKYGPFYNALDKGGLPVWGKPDRVFRGSDHKGEGKRIPSGWRRLAGIRTDSRNNIKFIFNKSVFKPALVFQEDVDVALGLAFGEKESRWPDLGLYETGHGMHPFPRMKIKEFGPNWLTVTDFGKTFYICDFLSGYLAWNIDKFKIAGSDGDPKLFLLGSAIQRMVQELEGDDPVHPEPNVQYNKIINNNPKFVDYTEKRRRGGGWDLRVHKILLGIDGGYTDDTKDREKGKNDVKPQNPEWLFRGDTKYKHPKLTRMLTDHFDLVAEIMPVYERLRQLIGMMYLLNDLRTKHRFMPNAKTRSDIARNLSRYKRRYESIGTTTEYIKNSLTPGELTIYGA